MLGNNCIAPAVIIGESVLAIVLCIAFSRVYLFLKSDMKEWREPLYMNVTIINVLFPISSHLLRLHLWSLIIYWSTFLSPPIPMQKIICYYNQPYFPVNIILEYLHESMSYFTVTLTVSYQQVYLGNSVFPQTQTNVFRYSSTWGFI